MGIKDKVKDILKELPDGCELAAAVKSRSPEEILEAVEAGCGIIGENYLQEADVHFKAIGRKASWHFIGHLQKNKVKKAVAFFDLIETVDSLEMAAEIDRRAKEFGKTMAVLIEVNSGREPQKFGVMLEKVESSLSGFSVFSNVRVMGLMTMGPFCGNPEDLRPYFRETRVLWGKIKNLGFPNVEMRYLSMGMSDSYRVAVQEGANLVRIGTAIFGKRPSARP